MSDPAEMLFRLLGRHLKEIQVEQYMTKFSTSGYEKEQIVNSNVLGDVFTGMNLREDYLKLV